MSMNKDFRLRVGMLDHPKTIRLYARYGGDGVLALLKLWEHAAVYKCDGIFRNSIKEDLLIAARLRPGDPAVDLYVETLVWLRFVDLLDEDVSLEDFDSDEARAEALERARVDIWFDSPEEVAEFLDAAAAENFQPVFALHNWVRHNAYAARAYERTKRASRNAARRWSDKKGKRNATRNAVSNATSNATSNANSNATSTASSTASSIAPSNASSTAASNANSNASGNAPSPSPSPTPSYSVRSDSNRSKPSMPGEDPVFCSFPTNRKNQTFEVLMSKIDEWKESYPAVDVEQEVRKCRQWNVDNPSRRKTARGVLKHVSAWLARCQDRGGSYGRGVDAFDGPKDVRSFSDEELERMKAQG